MPVPLRLGQLHLQALVRRQPNGLNVTGEFCYALSGSSCGGGLSISVTLNGTSTWSDEDVNIGVGGGKISSGSFSITGMSSELDLNYAVVRGDEPTVGAKPPVLTIPFSFETPPCGTPLGCAGPPVLQVPAGTAKLAIRPTGGFEDLGEVCPIELWLDGR